MLIIYKAITHTVCTRLTTLLEHKYFRGIHDTSCTDVVPNAFNCVLRSKKLLGHIFQKTWPAYQLVFCILLKSLITNGHFDHHGKILGIKRFIMSPSDIYD